MEINNTTEALVQTLESTKDLIFREQKASPQMFVVCCSEPFLICMFFSKSILVCVRLIPSIHMIPNDFPKQKNPLVQV